MKTVQMTLDDDLVKSVDRVAKQQKTSRSEFTRRALREALIKAKAAQMENLSGRRKPGRPDRSCLTRPRRLDRSRPAMKWGDQGTRDSEQFLLLLPGS